MIYKMLTLFRSQRKAIYRYGLLKFIVGKAHSNNKEVLIISSYTAKATMGLQILIKLYFSFL